MIQQHRRKEDTDFPEESNCPFHGALNVRAKRNASDIQDIWEAVGDMRKSIAQINWNVALIVGIGIGIQTAITLLMGK